MKTSGCIAPRFKAVEYKICLHGRILMADHLHKQDKHNSFSVQQEKQQIFQCHNNNYRLNIILNVITIENTILYSPNDTLGPIQLKF